jgi:hypothetical protein
MKRNVLYNFLLLPLVMLIATWGMSQSLAPDQNPNYLISEAKYSQMADSINSLHGTTIQDTYKAIDWMEQRAEAREARRAFRRELRLTRARYGYNYGYYPTYTSYPYYTSNYYHPYYYHRNWNWNRDAWSLVPLAASVAWWLTR